MIISKPSVKWFSIFKRILFVASLVMPVYYIANNVVSIDIQELNISYSLYVLSIALIMLALLVRFWTWNYLTLQFGVKISILDSGKSYFLSQLAKYVPGKIGIIVMRMQAYKTFPPRTLITTIIIEYIMGIIAACQVVLISLIFTKIVLPQYIRLIALVSFCVMLLMLYPAVFKFLIDRIMIVLKRDQIRPIPPFRTIIRMLIQLFTSNILNGTAFYILLKSINSSITIKDIPLVLGIYYGASLTGLVAFFAPAGLGVREGVLFLTLPLLFAISNAEVIIVALAMRMTIIISEYVLMGIFMLLKRRLA